MLFLPRIPLLGEEAKMLAKRDIPIKEVIFDILGVDRVIYLVSME
jgi:hypothetical protein